MALITPDELARGAILVVFGGGAGTLAMAAPGSLWWTVPALVGLAAGAATVPEVREELQRAAPQLTAGMDQGRRLLEDAGLVRKPKGGPTVGKGSEPPSALTTGTAADRPARAAAVAQAKAQSARPGPRTLTPQQFADDPLFRALNEEPHRLVIGHTQGGKSTALHGMAMAWAEQGHPVTVLDPDAARGQWPGCEVAGYAEDYRSIGVALERVKDLFEERSQLYAAGQRDFEPFHLVADEVHETIRNVPGSRDFLFETVARRGAKRGIFLTLGTQGNNADELDLESAGVLNNFITAEFEKAERGARVATVYRGNAARKKHVKQYMVPPLPGAKTFVTRADPEPVAQAAAPERQRQARAAAAEGSRPAVVSMRAPEPDPLLAGLLAGNTGQASKAAPKANDLPAELSALSPERAEKVRQILARQQQPAPAPAPTQDAPPPTAQQSVTVEQPGGGQVIVNVSQLAPSTARGGRPKAQRKGLSARERRQRADEYRAVRSVIARNGSANDAQREVGIKRARALIFARQAKAELGRDGGSQSAD